MSISHHQLNTESQLLFLIDHTVRVTVRDHQCFGTISIHVADHSSSWLWRQLTP